jgi:hypothetical protein
MEKLIYVAKTGGIKVESSENWINPANECKENILNNIESLRNMIGKKVIIELDNSGKYLSISPIKEESVSVSGMLLKILRGTSEQVESGYRELGEGYRIRYSQSHVIKDDTKLEHVLYVYYEE